MNNFKFLNQYYCILFATNIFIFIGLWVVCFKDFEDSHHWYDTKFGNCWWVFEEEYYIIYDILFKGMFLLIIYFIIYYLNCV